MVRLWFIKIFDQPLVRNVLLPPSMPMIWPVIHPASSDTNKLAIGAISSGSPRRGMACMAAMAVAMLSLLVKPFARSVRVKEGAMQLTRILGASSAANDRVSPSIAPFAMAIEAWA